MASGPSYLEKRNLGGARSSVSQSAAAPASPRTPQRNPPSTFSSPGGGLRSEEEYAIFEIGARHLSAGNAGDSRPKCTLYFDKEESRRIGDFTRWLPGYERPSALLKNISEWSLDYELWQLDLRDSDLSLIDDKFERAIRNAYSNHLLQDSKSRKLVLVVPSAIPNPILGVMLSTLFRNFQIPSITLFPHALLSLIAAGQRSGIVVDIGWHETVVTTVYELREISFRKTTRAMRMMTLAMGDLIEQVLVESQSIDLKRDSGDEKEVTYDFERAEESIARLAWCWPTSTKREQPKDMPDIEERLQSFSIATDSEHHEDVLQKQDLETVVALPTISSSDRNAEARFADLALPVEHTLFAPSDPQRTQDDEEQIVPFLLYSTLAELSADIRSTCMSNIVITGGGANIPGVKSRIIHEVKRLIEERGWDLVWGQASDKRRERLRELQLNRAQGTPPPAPKIPEDTDVDDGDEERPTVPAGLAEQESDPIIDKVRALGAKDILEPVSGTLRAVETLGSWAGASMVAGLKLRGVVEIDRDVYLQHGMAGAKKETDVNAAKSRQSMGAGLARAAVGDSSAWTLGPWA